MRVRWVRPGARTRTFACDWAPVRVRAWVRVRWYELIFLRESVRAGARSVSAICQRAGSHQVRTA